LAGGRRGGDQGCRQITAVEAIVIDEKLDCPQQDEGHARIGDEDVPDASFLQFTEQLGD